MNKQGEGGVKKRTQPSKTRGGGSHNRQQKHVMQANPRFLYARVHVSGTRLSGPLDEVSRGMHYFSTSIEDREHPWPPWPGISVNGFHVQQGSPGVASLQGP